MTIRARRVRRVGQTATTAWDGASARSLAQALEPPAADCIEANVPRRRIRPRIPFARALALTVTAHSVYRHPVARLFTAALTARLGLSPDLRERVHTALQEALMNAMLHGNLRFGSASRSSLAGLAQSHEIIGARFASRRIARSLIRVEATWTSLLLRLVIHDSGSGFQRNDRQDQDIPMLPLGSGRGLMILEMLCDRVALRRGGTTIALDFSRSPATA